LENIPGDISRWHLEEKLCEGEKTKVANVEENGKKGSKGKEKGRKRER
jgi:hypothetical protein